MAIKTITNNIQQEKGIDYSVITDTSADWSGVINDTYFYNLEDRLPYYKNASGDVIGVFEEGGSGVSTTSGSYSGSTLTLNQSDGSAVDITGVTGQNIYNTDDSLTGNRTVDLNGNSLTFSHTTNSNTGSLEIRNGQGVSVDRNGGTGTFVVKNSGVNKLLLGGNNDYWDSNTIYLGGTGSSTDSMVRIRRTRDVSFLKSDGSIPHLISPVLAEFFRAGFSSADEFIIGNTAKLRNEKISLQDDTLINGELITKASTTPVVNGNLFNDSFSFHIDSGELKGRYKDNLGVVSDLVIGSESIYSADGEITEGRTVDLNGNSLNFTVGQVSMGAAIGGNQSKLQITDDGADGTSYTNLLQLKSGFNTNIFRVEKNGNIHTGTEQGISETLTFGGGSSGDVATLTITNGLITGRTLVP